MMVFQDRAAYVQEDGDWRVPTVFDNLIHRKEMPATIGIFVNPHLPEGRIGRPQHLRGRLVPVQPGDGLGARVLGVRHEARLDTKGNLYVATEMGVQYCDQAGRVNGTFSKPQRAWLSNVASAALRSTSST